MLEFLFSHFLGLYKSTLVIVFIVLCDHDEGFVI